MDDIAGALLPGAYILNFFLSVLSLDDRPIPHGLFVAGSGFFAIIFWAVVYRVLVAIVLRLTGFDRPRTR